ncbi:22199_t:CDS:2, partial [Gigaspora margarita]
TDIEFYAIKEHAKTKVHIDSYIKNETLNVPSEHIISLMKIIYCLAKDDIPLNKFKPLVHLGSIVDQSTNISTESHIIFYAKYLINGIKIRFLNLLKIENGDAKSIYTIIINPFITRKEALQKKVEIQKQEEGVLIFIEVEEITNPKSKRILKKHLLLQSLIRHERYTHGTYNISRANLISLLEEAINELKETIVYLIQYQLFNHSCSVGSRCITIPCLESQFIWVFGYLALYRKLQTAIILFTPTKTKDVYNNTKNSSFDILSQDQNIAKFKIKVK